MAKKSVSKMTASFLIFFLSFVFMGASSFLARKKTPAFVPPSDEPSFNWHPELFKIITFGHTPAAVDWLLIRFMGESNIEHVKEGVRARVFDYLDLATDLDPAFFSLYTGGASFLVIAKNDKDSALALITKGEKFRTEELSKYPAHFKNLFWKDAWQVPYAKGYIHLFKFQDVVSANACYQEIDRMQDVPPQVKGLTEKITRSGGIYEIGMNVLTYFMNLTNDETLKREYSKKRESLFLSQYLFQLNDSFKKYKGSWSKFKNEHSVPDHDLWGGRIFLNPEGKIDSTTPRQKVLGLE